MFTQYSVYHKSPVSKMNLSVKKRRSSQYGKDEVDRESSLGRGKFWRTPLEDVRGKMLSSWTNRGSGMIGEDGKEINNMGNNDSIANEDVLGAVNFEDGRTKAIETMDMVSILEVDQLHNGWREWKENQSWLISTTSVWGIESPSSLQR